MRKLKQRNSQKSASEERNKSLLIGALGPEFTFTDNAAQWLIDKRKLGSCAKKLYNDIDEVVTAVKNGDVGLGIIPIENSIHGSVREALDSLFTSNLIISLKYAFPIHHVLACKKGAKLSQINSVFSHNQALSQCKKYLKKKLPKCEKYPYPSTVSAIKSLLVSKKMDRAVICSKEAAKKHKLRIIDKGIEDRKGNKTYFIVISKSKDFGSIFEGKLKEVHTSIAFYFGKDKPGTLYGVFKDFRDNKVNMTKIESRPTTKRFGEYIFFLDFEGDIKMKKVQKVLKSIDSSVADLKNFGSYPFM